MKPSEVGFNGSFVMWFKGLSPKPLTINLARSTLAPELFDTAPNKNFQLKNTFLFYSQSEPELFYRNQDGQLYTVNFEPYNENQTHSL